MSKITLVLIIILVSLAGCQHQKTGSTNQTVFIHESDGKFELFKDGKPYYIRGVSGHEHLDKVKLYGGNSIRTYDYTAIDSIMDLAAQYDLSVTFGLEVGREYWGNDFNYWNISAINEKVDELKVVVEKFKDHPALLMWSVGNEVHLHGGNRLMIFYTLNQIAKMIHDVDPNHPVITTLPAGENIDKYGYISYFMPHIDIIGFNSFGSIYTIKDNITKRFGWKGPYILSEWGSLGPWEVNLTEWGAPIEISNKEKVKKIEEHWDVIKGDTDNCLGSYVFYWGNKYEVTNSWFSLFSPDGKESDLVKILQTKWMEGVNFQEGISIDSMYIEHTKLHSNNRYLLSDSLYQAQVIISSQQQDSLTYKWELRPDGVDMRMIGNYKNNLTHLFVEQNGSNLSFLTPKIEGSYRLIIYVYDNNKNVAMHNIPFYVINH